MAKCISCGKKGLFIKVNKSGRCKNCEQLFQEEELKRNEKLRTELHDAELYFQKIVTLYNSIYLEIKQEIDYNQLSDTFSSISHGLELCENLKSLISSHKEYPVFYDILCQHTESDSYANCFVSELNLPIYLGTLNSYDTTIFQLSSIPDKFKRQFYLKKRKVENELKYREMLDSLEFFPPDVVSAPKIRLKVSELIEIKYSAITSKTNYERLGTFTVIDVETTGLNCQKNSIIEVSAVYFNNWEPKKYFSTLINPEISIPNEITELTGITTKMVESAPLFSNIVQSLSNFIGTENIVGHNLDFDLKFLYRNGVNFLSCKRKYYDTLQISNKLLKKHTEKRNGDVCDYKLGTLCEYYDIYNSNAHRSLSDCFATGLLFKNLANDRINNY